MKTIGILGFGIEGQATLRYLERTQPEARITIFDKNPFDVPGHTVMSGDGYLEHLADCDEIVKAPGISPNIPELQDVSEKITSATKLFFAECATRKAIIIGVTGTKGKSTTASLIYEALKAGGKDVILVGNIGKAALDQVSEIKASTLVVYELSSYQLVDLQVSPHIAVLTSLFPEHLDYHGGLEAYYEAKSHICRYQQANDVVYFNAENPSCVGMVMQSAGRKVACVSTEAPVAIEQTKLIGRHNLGNVALAFKVVSDLGVTHEVACEAFHVFVPLPHRLQSLGEIAGIEWVDDAISTTPESTQAGIEALGVTRVKTVILGGLDRGLDFTEFARYLSTQSAVEHVILFPETGEKIATALQAGGGRSINQLPADSMQKAVALAAAVTPAGAVCLLSTASPSYNMFKNFEDKGIQFQEAVKHLA